jgi:hypothetical protein
MWSISILGVPMVVIGLDLLTRRRLTNALREVLFRPEDTQLPEPRETVWAAALLFVGLILCAWGLKELVAPTKVVVADGRGLRLKVRGFRPPLALEWDQVEDVGSGTVSDDGDLLPVLWVRTSDPAVIPEALWGARMIDERTLAVLASDWETSHVAAAEGITAKALAVADLGQALPGPAADEP